MDHPQALVSTFAATDPREAILRVIVEARSAWSSPNESGLRSFEGEADFRLALDALEKDGWIEWWRRPEGN